MYYYFLILSLHLMALLVAVRLFYEYKKLLIKTFKHKKQTRLLANKHQVDIVIWKEGRIEDHLNHIKLE